MTKRQKKFETVGAPHNKRSIAFLHRCSDARGFLTLEALSMAHRISPSCTVDWLLYKGLINNSGMMAVEAQRSFAILSSTGETSVARCPSHIRCDSTSAPSRYATTVGLASFTSAETGIRCHGGRIMSPRMVGVTADDGSSHLIPNVPTVIETSASSQSIVR